MSALLQLPMTPFEWTMTEQVSGSPMEFFVKLKCVGTVDTEKFSLAIEKEVKRQPLLQSNAHIGPTHRHSFWVRSSNLKPELNWFDAHFGEEQGLPESFEPIDLTNEIGLRFYGWRFRSENEPKVVMIFCFHHACCDGKAGIKFVEQTLLRYQSLLESDDSFIPEPIDNKRIHARNASPEHPLSLLNRIRRAVWVRPRRVSKLLLTNPFQLTPTDQTKNLFDRPPLQCSTSFDEKITESLGRAAKSLQVTPNSLITSALFQTLENETETESQNRRQQMRILIPFCLRDKRHRQMPAANCVSMAYLHADKNLLRVDEENDSLAADLARQMHFIRRWRLEYSWLESIESYARFWPIIKFFKAKNNNDGKGQVKDPIATTVMTNLGRAFFSSALADSHGQIKIGPLAVETVHVAPPCNSGLTTIFSINFYRNRLTIDIVYLPSVVSREKAERLLASFARRIQTIAAPFS